jgi:hypothetical protein
MSNRSLTITRSTSLTSIPGSCSGAWLSRAGLHEAHITAGRKEENLLLSFRLFLHQQTKQNSNSHTSVRKHASPTQASRVVLFALHNPSQSYPYRTPVRHTRAARSLSSSRRSFQVSDGRDWEAAMWWRSTGLIFSSKDAIPGMP